MAARRITLAPAISALVGVAILIGLGVWQVQRLHWKQGILARIAALQAAPPRPLADVLVQAAKGVDVDYTRVTANCPAVETSPTVRVYAIKDAVAGWRLITACPIAAGPYASVLVDRGFIPDGATPTAGQPLSRPIIGVMRKGDSRNFVTPPAQPAQRTWYARDIPAMARVLGAPKPAPSFLMLESPAPPAGGPIPAPVPADIPNNHLQYAITWFGLAVALAGVYLASLLRRRR